MRFKLYEGRRTVPHTKKEMGIPIKEPDTQGDLNIEELQEESKPTIPDFSNIENAVLPLLEISVTDTHNNTYIACQSYEYYLDEDNISLFFPPLLSSELVDIHNMVRTNKIDIDYRAMSSFVIAIHDDPEYNKKGVINMKKSWDQSRDLWGLDYAVPFIRGRYGYTSHPDDFDSLTVYYVLDGINYDGINYDLRIMNEFMEVTNPPRVYNIAQELVHDILKMYYSGEIFSNAGFKKRG